jgi:hypothetical protein
MRSKLARTSKGNWSSSAWTSAFTKTNDYLREEYVFFAMNPQGGTEPAGVFSERFIEPDAPGIAR